MAAIVIEVGCRISHPDDLRRTYDDVLNGSFQESSGRRTTSKPGSLGPGCIGIEKFKTN